MIGFITGFPRSRTCWLSEALYVDRFMCVIHELSPAYAKIANISKVLASIQKALDVKIAIESSSALLLMADEMISTLDKETPIVLVERDSREARLSYQKAFSGLVHESLDPIWERLERGFELLRKSDRNVLVVQYSNLNTAEVMKIGRFLHPDFPESRAHRIQMLQKKKITQIP